MDLTDGISAVHTVFAENFILKSRRSGGNNETLKYETFVEFNICIFSVYYQFTVMIAS